MSILSVRDVSVRFGGIIALDRVSFEIEPRQIVGLIGPNGAGKTTLFNCVSRLYIPSAGTITFDGRQVMTVPPHRIAGLGIGRTFQNLALFPTQTVLQNVMVGAHSRTRSDFLSNALKLGWVAREEAECRAHAEELLEFLDLRTVAHQPAAGLPFATLKRVELARSLASRPALLLLDEPAGGLNHEEVGALAAVIRRIRDERGLTILLVEHHMSLVMQVSDKVVVLDFGRKIAEGSPAEVQRDPEVIRAYLGHRGGMSALLEVRDLEAFYGRTKALHGVSFSMQAGGITTILGANGAGKTTTLRAISRMVRTSGAVVFDGQPLDQRGTEEVVRLGIAHAPEGRGTFVHLTVEENLRLGAWGRRDRGGLAEDFDRVFGYFPVLRERRRQMGGTLSGGEQQMLAVARALMLRPRLLLLDEPSLGLAPLVVREIFRILRAVNRDGGVSILLVEQNAALALDLADHVFLIETGRVVLDGPSERLKSDDAIRRAYLGY